MKRKVVKALSFIAVITLVLVQSSVVGFAKSDNVVEDGCHGVVRVMAVYENSCAFGSGFAVGEAGEATDIFVTNHHVISDLENGDVEPEEIYLVLDDATVKMTTGLITGTNLSYDPNELVKCEILKKSDSSGYPDVAILKAERVVKERSALALSKAENSARADKVYSLGYPGDADYYNTETSAFEQDQTISGKESDITATDGTISAFRVFKDAGDTKVIQSTTSINHGNSGGPLINENGAVIGINTYGVGESSYSTAIYVDYAMEYLDDLGIKYDTLGADGEIVGGEGVTGVINTVIDILPIILALIMLVMIIVVIVNRKKIKRKPRFLGKKTSAAPEPSPQPAPVADAPVIPTMVLTGAAGQFAGHSIKVKGRTVLGTNSEVCNLVYEKGTPGVSRVHCIINVEGGNFSVTDAGSTYGTFVNGKKLIANEKMTLANGDTINLASQAQGFIVNIG